MRELVAARLGKFNYPEFAEQVWMPSWCFSYKKISYKYQQLGLECAWFPAIPHSGLLIAILQLSQRFINWLCSAWFCRTISSGYPEGTHLLRWSFLGMCSNRCQVDGKRAVVQGGLLQVSSLNLRDSFEFPGSTSTFCSGPMRRIIPA